MRHHNLLMRHRNVLLASLASSILLAVIVAGLAGVPLPLHAHQRQAVNSTSQMPGIGPCRVWTIVSAPTASTGDSPLNAIIALSQSDIWAVGYYDNIGSSQTYTLAEHFDGVRWHVVGSPNPTTKFNYLTGVAAASSGDVWAVGYSTLGNGAPNQTLIEHWNGTSWSIVKSPNQGTASNQLNAVVALSTTNAWAVGDYSNTAASKGETLVEHWNGTTWSIIPSPIRPRGPNAGAYPNYNLNAVTAIAANDIWAVGDVDYGVPGGTSLFEHWNGTAWSVVPSPSPSSGDGEMFAVAALSTRDVMAAGGSVTEHWNGTSWSVVQIPLRSPYTASPADGIASIPRSHEYWVVGDAYYVTGIPSSAGAAGSVTLTEHWNGTAWSVVGSPSVTSQQFTYSNYLDAVVALSSSDAWAVGGYGIGSPFAQALIEHYHTLPIGSPLCSR